MYKKLNLKIRLILCLFLISLIIGESIVSIFIISRNIRDNFVTFAEEKIELTIANSNFHFESISNFCTQISKTEDLVEKVKSGSFSLNNLPNTPQSIIGITVYNLNEYVGYSNNISNVPSLTILKTNDKINNFFESDLTTCYITRTTAIATFYSGLNYDPNYGVISNITKIYKNDLLTGYLVCDVRPLYLYTNIFDITDYYTDSVSYIYCNDGYLKSITNTTTSDYLEEKELDKIIFSKDNKYFIITKSLENIDADLIILIPQKNYQKVIFKIIYPILIINIGCISLAIFFSIRISKKITNSLKEINTKIENSDISNPQIM